MPTLNWIGKEKVVSHHQDVPYRVLEHQYGFTAEHGEQKAPTDSGNKIIHGDNLEALKSLLPEYEGKVKCIYIDPPYNTGNENWVYNDNVNHPKIKKWLGEVVGKDGEDLTRHDKWLCMMYPRLQLLHKLLADDGAIFISIDDYEYQNLVIIMDEIFGVNNKIANVIWDLGTGTQAGHLVRAHEYILVYSKNKNLLPNFKGREGIIKHSALKKISYKNPSTKFVFPSGTRFDAADNTELVDSWGGAEKTKLIAGKMIAKNGKLVNEVTLSAGWAMKSQMQSWFYEDSENTFDTKGQRVKEFYFNKNGVLTYIKEKSVTNPPTVLRNIANTKSGSVELSSIIGSNKFDFPKPSELIRFLLKLIVDKNDIILDSFAGTGTTAQSVLNMNKQDGGNRKFILVEMEDYAEEITAKRVKKVSAGYEFTGKKKEPLKTYSTNITNLKKADRIVKEYEKFKKDKTYSRVQVKPVNNKITIIGEKQISGKAEGLGGSFDYYELGLPLFDESHNLNEKVDIAKIQEYIWFSETRTAFAKPNKEKYFLGKKEGSVYYFIYEKDRLTTLDYDTLELIKTKGEQYIVYADNCLLPAAFMAKKNIIFKKIPRDITKF